MAQQCPSLTGNASLSLSLSLSNRALSLGVTSGWKLDKQHTLRPPQPLCPSHRDKERERDRGPPAAPSRWVNTHTHTHSSPSTSYHQSMGSLVLQSESADSPSHALNASGRPAVKLSVIPNLVCLPASHSACLPLSLSVSLCLSVRPSVSMSLCLSQIWICLSTHDHVCQQVEERRVDSPPDYTLSAR